MLATAQGARDAEVCPSQRRRTFKARVARAAVRREGTRAERTKHRADHPVQLTAWTDQRLASAAGGFRRQAREPPVNLKSLYAMIDQLTRELLSEEARSARSAC